MNLRPSAALLLILAGGCSAVLGIGDLPGPSGDGAGADGGTPANGEGGTPNGEAGADGSADGSQEGGPTVTCTGNLTACGVSCVNLQNAKDNCGTCGNVCSLGGSTATCDQGLCKGTVDVSSGRVWQLAVGGPYMTFWKDGTLLVSDGGSSTSTIAFTDEKNPVKRAFFANLPGRQSGIIPTTAGNTEYVVSHYGSFLATAEDGGTGWNNSIHGCCGTGPGGFTIDPIQNRLFTGHWITEINTADGTTISYSATHDNNDYSFDVAANAIYAFNVGVSHVDKYSRDHTYQWSVSMAPTNDANVTGEPALGSDDGIVVPSSGWLTRLTPAGTKAWEVAVDTPQFPITTSDGLVVLGANVSGTPNLCAFVFANATQKWCTPVDGTVIEVLSGNDGVLYVAESGQSKVYGFDRATGALRYTFTNITTPTEMLLRGSRLFVYGANTVTSLAVPATKYDASSWPVRFHDNQRTRGNVSSLDY